MSQIALPLDVRSLSGSVRLAVGLANQDAVAALEATNTWPFCTAILVGPPRSGKSVLANWFERGNRGEIIDDACGVDETVLFHAWNRAQETARPLLLTARPDWRVRLPDLASRLAGSLNLVVHDPDDDLVTDLLTAHAEQRRIVLGEGAAAYLAPRIERSYAAIEAVVAAIDRLSLERQAPVTMSVWRDALEALQGPEQGRLL